MAPHGTSAHYGLDHYVKGALAGGICCGATHGAMCPVDVVKTRIQLDPVTYNKGMIGGFRQVIASEGIKGLATGLGPTAVGYFVQGWFKFGGVELFKIKIATSLGEKKAWDNRNNIYLISSACAEFIADIFLCPLEAARIRLVSNPTYASGTIGTMTKMAKEMGVIPAFYSGFGPILFKQVPYTMAKFAVQGKAAETIYNSIGTTPQKSSPFTNVCVSLGSGVIAGVAAAVISHPADTLLSKVNKAGAGGTGTITQRLVTIAKQTGFVGLCLTGLGPRCVMIGTLTALQFGIFDTIMHALGATRFHFHNPDDHH